MGSFFSKKVRRDDFARRLAYDSVPSQSQSSLNQAFLQNHPVIDDDKEPNDCASISIRWSIRWFILSISVLVDTLQFVTGLEDVKGKLFGIIGLTPPVRIFLGALYAFQAGALNQKYTFEDLDKMGDRLKDKRVLGWAELSPSEKRKTYTASFITNFIALSFDAMMVAYYLQQQGFGFSNATNFMIGAAASATNVPEPVGLHEFLHNYFSKKVAIVNAALKEIHASDFYSKRSYRFQKRFDKFWKEKLSLHLLHTLSKPDFQDLNGKTLAEELFKIFEKTDAKESQRGLANLYIPQTTAEKFALRLNKLKALPSEEARPVTMAKNIADGVCTVSQNVVKGAGMVEDMVECYTTMAAFADILFGLNSPEFRIAMLFLSLPNGIVDLKFNGEVTSDAIEKFKYAVTRGNYTAKDVMIFLPAFVFAAAIAYAQLSLILDLLHNPDAKLPFTVPDWCKDVVGYGAGLRELVLYTSYFWDGSNIAAKKLFGKPRERAEEKTSQGCWAKLFSRRASSVVPEEVPQQQQKNSNTPTV